MKSITKAIAAAVTTVAITVSLVGCGSKNEPVKQDKSPNKIAQDKNANKVVQDKNLTSNLKKEKEISDGQVYVQNNTAIATMIIKAGVSQKNAKVLAEKYAKELKKTHKGMKVNVQAVQKGKNIVNITK